MLGVSFCAKMHLLYQLTLASLAYGASLPPPSGMFSVGASQHVIQHTTPHDPTPGPGNQLLVHLYYPTMDSANTSTVPYFDPQNADIWKDLVQLPKDSLMNLTTALKGNASFLGAPTGRPTILFSPGAGINAWMYYGIVADLASNGHTVVAVDHPGEAPALRWPNGTETIGWNIDLNYTMAQILEINTYRVTDLDAVLSWFRTHVRTTHAPFDVSRIIAMGHSIGGSAAITITPGHEEIKGAVNLDGAFPDNKTTVISVGRPVFLMSSVNHTTQYDPTWAQFQDHQTGWWESVSIYGSVHIDYSDITTWGVALGFPPIVEEPLGGPTGGVRTTQIIRQYLADFSSWIQGNGQGVMTTPSLEWKEVIYVNGSNVVTPSVRSLYLKSERAC